MYGNDFDAVHVLSRRACYYLPAGPTDGKHIADWASVWTIELTGTHHIFCRKHNLGECFFLKKKKPSECFVLDKKPSER